MQGGVILFRGTGTDALRYVEADRSRADDYYLEGGATVAQFTALDSAGKVTAALDLEPAAYAGWVDWTNPLTGEQMGRPRRAGSDRLGSPRFAEMVINTPKSLSVAAALHPEVSVALDAAQQDALAEIRRWLAQHSVTRVGPLGAQEVVPAERMQVVDITHRTSRAGDPHRHVHMQIGTRIYAAGKWRALDTGALFRQQGAIRALGTAVIAAHPGLADTLARHGLTLNAVSGEVVELQPFSPLMSKRGAQVTRNLDRLEAEWQIAHPGEVIGPVVASRLRAQAWALDRPAKKPATARQEAEWITELREAGYDQATLRQAPPRATVGVDDLSVQAVASRALDRCAAASSAWTVHAIREHATRITTEHGIRATPAEVRDFTEAATRLALSDCFTILPPDAPTPEHVAHLTSVRVIQAETELRDLIAARVPTVEPEHPDVTGVAARLGQQLDPGQLAAASAVASNDPLVVVEGAAGSGKTTMLATAITAVHAEGGRVRVLAPTRKAADVARQALGVPADSVAALVHAHGWRWNTDGVWTRLAPGDTDPETGHAYIGPTAAARLRAGDRVVVDEAGMLDQDSALALFALTAEHGATIALIGDRAQLPAVGRGGVLDMAAHIRGRTIDMAEVHRFTDPAYAALTIRLRSREDPGSIFDQLDALGLIRLHDDTDGLREHITTHHAEGDAVTVATNEEAARLNEHIRETRVRAGLVDDTVTTTGSDGLSIGRGDLIQTRRNDTTLGVVNRQQWVVQHVEADGTLWAVEAGSDRKRERSVRLPAGYVAEHAHLAYASTAYGVQGVTAEGSHTILTDAMTGAGVYVGLTRGKHANELHVVAGTLPEARAQFIDAVERDRADRGLTDATRQAVEAVAGLTDDGPAKRVRADIAALTRQAERAEQRAVKWQEAARLLHDLTAREQAERETLVQASSTAQARVDSVRAEVAQPLTEQATAAFEAWRDATATRQDAQARLRTVGRFGKRRAQAEDDAAALQAQTVEQHITTVWGTPPRPGETAAGWVQRVTGPKIEADPGVIAAANQQAAAAQAVRRTLDTTAHDLARLREYARVFGTDEVDAHGTRYLNARPTTQADRATQTARAARAEADTLRAMTPTDAVARIQRTRAEQAAQEAARAAAAERARRTRDTSSPAYRPRQDGPNLGR